MTAPMDRPRIANVAIGHAAAREWEILQELAMTHEERQEIARELKRRVYGPNPPDIREAERAKDLDDLEFLTHRKTGP